MTAPVLSQKKFYVVKPYGGYNYLKNPAFAEPVGVTYWAATQAAMAITGDEQRHGAYSVKVTPVTGQAAYIAYAGLAVTAGLAYTFSCDVKGVDGQAMRIYIGADAATTFTATGYWQRVQVTKTIGVGVTETYVVVQRDSVASTSPFYVDGVQFEQAVKATTFIEGNQAGCGWTGLPLHSTSWRDPLSAKGGLLVDLEDYCYVVQAIGLGHGDWNQILTKMTSGGDMYQTHIRKSHNFSIIVDFLGNSLSEIEGNRAAVIDLIRPDLAEGQERIIRYQGTDVNGVDATNPVDIVCVPLSASMVDTPELPTYQRAVLNFSIPSGLLEGAYNEGAVLDFDADFVAEFIVKRDANGNYVEYNSGTGEYDSLITGLNGTVYCMAEGPDGKIYAGGAFTDAGGTTDADKLARWNPVSEEWEAVGSMGAGEIVQVSALDVAPNGDLYIGLVVFEGAFSAPLLYKYDGSDVTLLYSAPFYAAAKNSIECFARNPNTGFLWVGGEIHTDISISRGLGYWDGSSMNLITTSQLGIYAMAWNPQGTKLYIGGSFTNATTDSTGDYLAYYDTDDSAFHMVGTVELNGAVYSLAFGATGYLYAGGAFTNAGGNPNADYIARWNGSQWESLGTGTNGTVYGITVNSGKVYATGTFTTAGGLTLTDRIAIYSNGAWQPLDIDLPGTETVHSILPASDGSLYIGGAFSTAGEAPDENATCGVTSDRVYTIGVASASANTYPCAQITGPGTLKSLTNYKTNKAVMFDGLTLNAGEKISLNFDPLNLVFKSAWAGRGNLMRYVVSGSDYGDFYLKPGTNSLSLYMTESTTDSGATITWTPLFWGLDGAVL